MDDIKVLMIDDDELIARSTSEYFNIVGVKTAYVTSYDAAVEFLDKQEVSLLLMDINLGDVRVYLPPSLVIFAPEYYHSCFPYHQFPLTTSA